jgi:hypothetical protein
MFSKHLMLSLQNSWIFLIIGSSSSYHGQVYVMIDWRPCPLSLYICLVTMQSIDLKKIQKKNLSLMFYPERKS